MNRQRLNAQLASKFKPTISGPFAFLDAKLMRDTKISDSAKLVYAVMYNSIPKHKRLENIALGFRHEYFAAKTRIWKHAGISRSTYYDAINQLEENNYITTHVNADNKSVTFYVLHYNIDVNNIVSFIPSEVLQKKYVKTDSKLKTLSPKAKIAYGRLQNLSRNDYNRKINMASTELIHKLNLARSTTYYMINRLMSCNALSKDAKRHGVMSLLLLDEYTQYQALVNADNKASYEQSRIDELDSYGDRVLDSLTRRLGLKKYS